MNMSDAKRIEELLEDIRNRQGSVAKAPTITPRYITLHEWAKATFSKAPHSNTLLKWVHEGRIHPQPKKMGRAWQVRPTAEYRAD